ncbi:transcription-repair coupling factor, partial [Streptococcus danieliae]|nr:transcription-repair coupling factor [Streptococcus danieliae]
SDLFDLVTQKSIKKIEFVKIYPTSDFFLTEEEKSIVIKKLEQMLEDVDLNTDQTFLDIKKELKSKIKLYRKAGIFDELDFFSNYIYDECYSIFDYIDKDAIVFFDSYMKINEKNISLQEYFLERLKEISFTYLHQDILDLKAYDKFISSNNKKYNLTLLKSDDRIFK